MIKKFKNIKDTKLINISELAKKLNLINSKTGKPSTHTLRFWESKFSKIRPTILNGKRRFYSNKDTELFFLIKFLLKDQKLTIDGAKNIINKNIYNLDDFKSSSIKALYFKSKIETKTKNLLKKIKTL